MIRLFLIAIVAMFGAACFAVDQFGAAAVYFTIVKPVLDVPPGELIGYSLIGILIDVVVIAGLADLFRRFMRRRREARAMVMEAAGD